MYKFIKKGQDDYSLQIGKEELPFKRTNETATILQDANRRTEINMMKYLAQNKLTKKDFIIETNDGKGHTTKDETNYLELKNNFYGETVMEILNELIKKDFKMDMMELFNKMGIDLNSADMKEQNKISDFTQEYLTILTGNDKQRMKTPSEK